MKFLYAVVVGFVGASMICAVLRYQQKRFYPECRSRYPLAF
jgi:hypothetical protein